MPLSSLKARLKDKFFPDIRYPDLTLQPDGGEWQVKVKANGEWLADDPDTAQSVTKRFSPIMARDEMAAFLFGMGIAGFFAIYYDGNIPVLAQQTETHVMGMCITGAMALAGFLRLLVVNGQRRKLSREYVLVNRDLLEFRYLQNGEELVGADEIIAAVYTQLYPHPAEKVRCLSDSDVAAATGLDRLSARAWMLDMFPGASMADGRFDADALRAALSYDPSVAGRAEVPTVTPTPPLRPGSGHGQLSDGEPYPDEVLEVLSYIAAFAARGKSASHVNLGTISANTGIRANRVRLVIGSMAPAVEYTRLGYSLEELRPLIDQYLEHDSLDIPAHCKRASVNDYDRAREVWSGYPIPEESEDAVAAATAQNGRETNLPESGRAGTLPDSYLDFQQEPPAPNGARE